MTDRLGLAEGFEVGENVGWARRACLGTPNTAFSLGSDEHGPSALPGVREKVVVVAPELLVNPVVWFGFGLEDSLYVFPCLL